MMQQEAAATMNLEETEWILKVLSGLHVGAEVSLQEQATMLGRDEDCDLVLDDVSLAARHISLRVADGQVMLKLLDGSRPVYVGVTRLEEGEVALEPFQPIALGTLFLAVGPAAGEWPVIDLQQAQKVIAPPAEDEQAPGEGMDAAEDEADEAPGGEAQGGQAEPAQETPPPAPRRRWLLVPATLVVLTAAGLLFYMLAAPLLERQDTGPSQAEMTATIQRLAERHYAKVEFSFLSKGGETVPYITGHIVNNIHLRAFRQELLANGIAADIKLVAMDEIRQAIAFKLEHDINRDSTNKVTVASDINAPGDLTLRGYVSDASSWQAELAQLREEFHGYRQLIDQVDTILERRQALEAMLEDGQLGRLEVTQTRHGLLIAEEQLTADEQRRLREVVADFTKRFGQRPALAVPSLHIMAVTPANTMEAKQLQLDIVGIGFGPSPHVTLNDKRRYGIGSVIRGGYVLKEIKEGYLLLEQDGQELIYRLEN